MPNAYNRAKMTGDTHLPDVENDMSLQESMSEPAGDEEASGHGVAAGRGGHNSPARARRQSAPKPGGAQAGHGRTRDSGEGGPSSR